MKGRFAFRFSGRGASGLAAMVIVLAAHAAAEPTVIIGEGEDEEARVWIAPDPSFYPSQGHPSQGYPSQGLRDEDRFSGGRSWHGGGGTVPEPYSHLPRQGIRLCPPGRSCPSYRSHVPKRSQRPSPPRDVTDRPPKDIGRGEPPEADSMTMEPPPLPKGESAPPREQTFQEETAIEESVPSSPPTLVDVRPIVPPPVEEEEGEESPSMAPPSIVEEAAPANVDESTDRSGEAALTSLNFDPDQVRIDSEHEEILRRLLARASEGGESVEVFAYGESDEEDPSAERRQALKRALSVRAFLVENGLPHDRTTLRVIGRPSDGSSPSRVDLRLIASDPR